jgi:hypothetical protein
VRRKRGIFGNFLAFARVDSLGRANRDQDPAIRHGGRSQGWSECKFLCDIKYYVSTRSNRILRRFVIILAAIATLIVAIGAPPLFLWATAKPLHPEPQNAPSAVQSEPSPQWAAAVGRARPIVRAVLSGQNLPGLSVAVGVGGDIVWAEGFGWADVRRARP